MACDFEIAQTSQSRKLVTHALTAEIEFEPMIQRGTIGQKKGGEGLDGKPAARQQRPG
jgi:hypothetical protein